MTSLAKQIKALLAGEPGSEAVFVSSFVVPQRQGQTPFNGTPLINGTQAIVTWAVPDDGVNHHFWVAGTLNVMSVNETGGQILASFTTPDGASATSTMFASSQVVGHYGASLERMVSPGTIVSVTQNTALTAGGPSTVWIDLFGI